jgi:putative ABC transport system permease protein
MRLWQKARLRLRTIFRRDAVERELAAEMRAHLEEEIAGNAAAGMTPDDARLAALRSFGGAAQIAEECRDARGLQWLESFFQDVRYGFRQLRRVPTFALAGVLTLALGIGANTVVFSVVDAVVMRPLPYPQSDRLVSVLARDTQEGTAHPDNISYPEFFALRKQNRTLEHIACYRDNSAALSGAGEAVNIPAEIVSWELFDVLRVQPVLGRSFRPEEENAGQRVVIIGHQLWKDRFNQDRGIIGKTITLNLVPYVVIGVAPPGFVFPADNREVQIWTTLAQDASSATKVPMTQQPGAGILSAIGRLRAGVSINTARADLDTVAAALAHDDPADYANRPATWTMLELERVAGDTRRPLLILLGAVGLVLLVACANVANLLLARMTERQREFAVRACMGAARKRIVRQLLSESLTLALLGSGVGLLFAIVCLKGVKLLTAGNIPRIEQASVDGRVLAFSIGLAVLTSILFSLAPAIRLSRMQLITPLKEVSRGNTGGGDRFRKGLVVFQIALGLVLVSGAGILGSSFASLMHRDVGFPVEGLLSFGVSMPQSITRATQHITFESRVVEGVRALPGVTSVAVAVPLPLAGHQIQISFNIEERSLPEPQRPSSDMAIVTPEYFKTAGIPLLEGRGFTESDDGQSPPVLIVNRAFADKFFPGEKVIGKRIEPGAVDEHARGGMREIVGVVGNARQDPLGSAPDPIYYYAEKQLPWCCLRFIARTSGSSPALEPAIRRVVASVDPTAPVFNVRRMNETLTAATGGPRLQVILLGAFAAIAVLLTAVGLYGVLAYSVLNRTREIGIRVALGADSWSVLWMVLREVAVLVGIGVALGVVGAAAGNRIVSTMVYATAMPQPLLLAATCGVILLTAIVAALAPARRATSVDPTIALRYE